MSKPPPVLIAPSFRRTLIEIYDYLYDHSPNAAESLVQEVNSQIKLIANYPTAYPHENRIATKRRIYRFKKVKKNYKVIFKALKTKTIFIAVIYAKRSEEAYQALRTTKYK